MNPDEIRVTLQIRFANSQVPDAALVAADERHRCPWKRFVKAIPE